MEGIQAYLNSVNDGTHVVVAVVKRSSVRDRVYNTVLTERLHDVDAPNITYAVAHMKKGSDAKKDSYLVMRRGGFAAFGEEELMTLNVVWNEVNVAKWILEHTYPLVGASFTQERYSVSAMKRIGKEGAVVVLLNLADDTGLTAEEATQVKELTRSIAARTPRWKFTVASVLELSAEDKELLGTSTSITLFVEKGKYRASDLNETAIVKFLDAASAGKVKPWFKSAPAPANVLDQDDVTTIVGSTFEDTVLDATRDVFVAFYAPWCGHCRKFAPAWADLGRTVKGHGWRNVVIARMDITANECQEEVSHYPKLVLYPAVAADRKFKTKVPFGGARDVATMSDFLLENARTLGDVDVEVLHKTARQQEL